MGSGLFQTICRTGIFMICAQTITQFRPNASYEKYLKLLVSIMVLIQLFLPLGSLLSGAGRRGMSLQWENFREELEQGLAQTRSAAEEMEALLEQMTLEEVRRRMGEQPGTQDGQQAQDGPQGDWDRPDAAALGGGPITVEVEPVAPILGNGQGKEETE